MRILVTGGSGFIGTNLVRALGARHDVYSIDPAPPRDSSLRAYWRQADLLDRAAIADAVQDIRPTHVVHLGARTDLDGRAVSDYAANTTGVTNLIAALELLSEKPRTIYASSRLVFRIGHSPRHDYDYDPSTPYGESKIVGEEIVRAEASAAGEWILARPTSIWGPWFATPYRDFFDMVAKGRYVNPAGRDVEKSFGYVGNTVHQIEAILNRGFSSMSGEVTWLADYPPTNVAEWASVVADGLGVRRPRTVPLWMLRGVARVGDGARRTGLLKHPPLTTFRLNNLISPMVYDTSRLESFVGPLPYTIQEGVGETIAWLRSSGGR